MSTIKRLSAAICFFTLLSITRCQFDKFEQMKIITDVTDYTTYIDVTNDNEMVAISSPD